jgi:hypothetical protein
VRWWSAPCADWASPSEIQEPAGSYLGHPDEPIGPRLAQALRAVRTWPERRIKELQALIQRITAHEADHADELFGRADFRAGDRFGDRRA